MSNLAEPAIIYEDNHILAVIKPQNVPTVADASGDESLQEQLKQYIKQRDNKQGDVFVGVVHRLDRVTGGVMVFAKTSKAAARLTEQIQNGTFHKIYLAVIDGVPQKKSATLINYLAKDESKNIVSVVPQTTEGARRAELSYEVTETASNAQFSLLKINIFTGRSHQIRVQLQHIGHPVHGDARYGVKSKTEDIALWAYQLQFVHPTTGDELKFVVNPPETGIWQNFDFNRKGHLLRGTPQ
jgi:23S rRNA pseudouridine1911/1915/1917 synthase